MINALKELQLFLIDGMIEAVVFATGIGIPISWTAAMAARAL